MNKYEAMIIFRESLKDTEWDEAVEAVKAEVEKQGGTMSSCTRLGKREFARAMKKQTGGHYALLALQLDGQKHKGILKSVEDRIFTITVQEKQTVEGKKRPVIVDIDKTYSMDEVKSVKYLLAFK